MTHHATHAHEKPTSAQWRAALLDSQRRVLERIASGAPLEEVLHTLVHLIEEQAGELRCGVLLADAAQTQLRFAAAPGFPDDLKKSMVPFLRIAPNMGSCGTAAYRREPVYTRDTASDPLWEPAREIALRNSVRAIWSTPIVADDNRVLGTFAMFYREPRLPTEEHIQLIDMAVQLARVAIESHADDDLLRTTFDNAPTAMIITDMELRIVRPNRAFAERLGYSVADLRAKPMAEITEGVDEQALVKELVAGEGLVLSDRRYRTRDGRLLWARERSSVRRDASGKPRYVVTRVDQLSEADPLGRLSRRERQVLKLVVVGRTSKEIAARLHIAPASVDTYRSRIMLKLGVDDLPALVRFAIRHGVVRI